MWSYISSKRLWEKKYVNSSIVATYIAVFIQVLPDQKQEKCSLQIEFLQYQLLQ